MMFKSFNSSRTGGTFGSGTADYSKAPAFTPGIYLGYF
jgi:hypothetical protein